jgi:hypothetical protein
MMDYLNPQTKQTRCTFIDRPATAASYFFFSSLRPLATGVDSLGDEVIAMAFHGTILIAIQTPSLSTSVHNSI